MKLFVIFFLASLAFAGFAETNVTSDVKSDNPVSGKKFTPEQIAANRARRAARIAARIEAEGGMITKPNGGNFARVVNAQKTVKTEFVKNIVDQFNTGLNVWIEVTDMEPGKTPFATVKMAQNLPRTGFVTVIVEDDDLPTILSAFENGWSILNVKHLRDDLPPKDVYENRLRKEINRAFAQSVGAGISYNRPCVMEPAFTATQVDALKFPVISPEAISKIQEVCAMRNVEAITISTYKDACQDGWAPVPTNEVQKALWNEVHAVPSNPIKIQYDPKRDAGK